jgi:protein-S-isoprenylcysteine O-methyltransferase Ste14
MSRNPAVNFAAILFAVVSIAHLLRIVFDVPVTVADESIPMWVSVIGVVVPGMLAWLLFRNHR